MSRPPKIIDIQYALTPHNLAKYHTETLLTS
ncbi:MAG TPA: hypothetical protein [Caudoviricetes sp.]|nr:MAG TPA: hypothetical protein [Caudoviricetes sp.]